MSGHGTPTVIPATAHATVGAWSRTSHGRRHASSPPTATKTMKARWTTTTRSASTR
ncbi:MAG TPA: hypothetical protein VHF27_01730 [Acidimicrobiales bacterium]|nr:hypothetical protein [Acidimicrobiales bacterium]